MAQESTAAARLRPSVEPFLREDDTLHLLPPPGQPQFEIPGPQGRAVADVLLRGHPAGPDIAPLVDELIDMGLAQRAVPQHWAGSRADRLARYLDGRTDAATAIERLERARVLLLGVGGVGSMVAEHLARVGIGMLAIVDDDVVTTENLGRCACFGPDDIGSLKVVAAEQVLRRISPETTVITTAIRVASAHDVAKLVCATSPDVVVACCDTPIGVIEEWIDQASREAGVAWVTGGQFAPFACAGPMLIPDLSPCISCVRRPHSQSAVELELARHRRTSEFIQPAVGALDAMIAAPIVLSIIEFLCGLGPSLQNREVVFDSGTWATDVTDLSAIACSHRRTSEQTVA